MTLTCFINISNSLLASEQNSDSPAWSIERKVLQVCPSGLSPQGPHEILCPQAWATVMVT